MSFRQLTDDFMSSTTTHGIGAIFLSKGLIKKAFWILVTMGAAVALFFNMAYQITKYFSYPITVEVSIAHANGIEFPAVTICNINPIKKSFFQNIQSNVQARKKRSTDSQINAECCCSCCATHDNENKLSTCNLCSVNSLMKSMCKPPKPPPTTTTTAPITIGPMTVAVTDTQPPPTTTTSTTTTTKPIKVTKKEYKNAEILTEQIVKMSPLERETSGYSIDDLILNCSYAGSNCDPKSFTRIDNPIHGNCYIFNSGWNISSLISHKTGRRYGLVMTINVNQDEYIKDAGDTAGIRLQVHPGSELPFPEDQGILVAPGYSTSISLQKVVLSRIGGKYSNCVEMKDFTDLEDKNIYNEMYPKTHYTQGACHRSCYQGNVIEKCECADPYYPFYGKTFDYVNWTVCSISNKTQERCRKTVLEDYNSNRIKCDCPVVCKQTTYSTSISLGKWPSNVLLNETLKYLKDKVSYDIHEENKYKQNLLTVEIFFEEFNFQVISESPGYEVSQLLSDIGGVIGLYMGMSFMSLIEVIEFIIMLCNLGTLKAFKRLKNAQLMWWMVQKGKEENKVVDGEGGNVGDGGGEAVENTKTRKAEDYSQPDSIRDVLLKF